MVLIAVAIYFTLIKLLAIIFVYSFAYLAIFATIIIWLAEVLALSSDIQRAPS